MYDSSLLVFSDVRQWEYISYCLSQLTFTEKGLKKLIDNFKMFEHALCEDSVLNHFSSVIAKVGCLASMAAYDLRILKTEV